MDKNINEKWRMMPLFYLLHSDTTFDKSFVFKGVSFIFSIILFPLTFPCYLIGICFKNWGKNGKERNNL